jgi:hypothetical protein
MHALQ